MPAVTLGAAEQWLGVYPYIYIHLTRRLFNNPDVYQAANERNAIVVGGAARSVGAAGGWVQGGGHSPLGALYEMGIDSEWVSLQSSTATNTGFADALQFTVVKPNGKIVTANACQNKDLFWALRGGGGSTWGVSDFQQLFLVLLTRTVVYRLRWMSPIKHTPHWTA